MTRRGRCDHQAELAGAGLAGADSGGQPALRSFALPTPSFTLRWLRWYCAAFAAINLIVETRDVGDLRLGVMSFSNVNTADPLYALFGLAGIAALLLLLPRFATVVPDDPPGAA